MKNPLRPAGIEPATFRFVAQHLNHCATAVPVVLRESTRAQEHKSHAPIQLLVNLTVRKFPEDGSPVTKPVGLDIHHELYFVASY